MNTAILPVLDEISAILKKNDMTGLIIVGNPTHVDWRLEVSASWSCANWNTETGQLRIRAKAEDFPSREAQMRCMEQTIGNFVSFKDALTKMGEQLDRLLIVIGKHIKFIGRSTEE